jgi:hypothetical protein
MHDLALVAFQEDKHRSNRAFLLKEKITEILFIEIFKSSSRLNIALNIQRQGIRLWVKMGTIK